MRVVDRKTFLALPSGTIYAKFEPCVLEDINVKRETWDGPPGYTGDWIYEPLGNPFDFEGHDEAGTPTMSDACFAMTEKGVSIPNTRCTSRDGCYDKDQLFLVWERGDVLRMQEQISEALATAYRETDNAETD